MVDDPLIVDIGMIGHDDHQGIVNHTWEFLRRYVQNAHAFVFSRGAYAPPWIDRERLTVIAPSIDPFSAKNHDDPDHGAG